MATIKKLNVEGAEVGTVEASDAVFAAEANEPLVHDVVIGLQANLRQGNHETKTRSDVAGSGKKPFRQKGTGRARQGCVRAPQYRHGGTVFGPHPRSYKHAVPLRWRRQALACLLSARLREARLDVLSGLQIAAPKTKPFAQMISRVAPGAKRTLLVTAGQDRATLLSARNVPGVMVRTAEDVNALDVILATRVVVQEEALAKLQERLS
jgi:large subunit ribosomal protein L4